MRYLFSIWIVWFLSVGILSAQELNTQAIEDLLEMEDIESLDNVGYVTRIESRLNAIGASSPQKLNELLSLCSINEITEKDLLDSLATVSNGFLSKETLASIDSASLTHTMIIKEAVTQFLSDSTNFGDAPDFYNHFWKKSVLAGTDPSFREIYLTPPNLYFLIWLSLLTLGFLFLLIRPKKKEKKPLDSIPTDKKDEEKNAVGVYKTLEAEFKERLDKMEKEVTDLKIRMPKEKSVIATKTETQPESVKTPIAPSPPPKPKVQYYAQTPNNNGVFFKIKKTHDPGITYFLITEISPDQASVSFIDDIQVKKAALNYFDKTIIPVFEVKNSVSPAEADASNIVVVKEARVKKEGDNWKIIEKGIIEF